jgi:DNA helicase-2/ATP-dependent DNA helicase PcrA
MPLLDKLNDIQKQAVMFKDGQLLILAGAGSGKTRVLTHRIAYLIESGVSPYNILAITFTNKAAQEMKGRVIDITPYGRDVWVSTFHSLCVRVLRIDIHNLGYDKNFTIYDAEDSLKVIRNCIKELDINEKQVTPRNVASAISSLKDKLISSIDYSNHKHISYYDSQVSKIYFLYQKKLNNNNALDFDDLIFKTVELFHYHPNVLDKYQEKFKYILVDEYQDTNMGQYELIKKLAMKYGNLCAVGDDDQSIYGWRGADINNILGFEKDFKGACVMKLEQNYRSTQNILSAANLVIENNRKRKGKKLWTDSLKGKGLELFEAYNEAEEAYFVVQKIRGLNSKGMKYNDMAALYRTNVQSRALEEALVGYSIPYRIFGGVRFYDRKEIKDIIAYLRLIVNPRDEVSFSRVINTPKRGIGESTINKISLYAYENNIPFYDALSADIPSLKGKAKPVKEFFGLIEKIKGLLGQLTLPEFIRFLLEEVKYIEAIVLEGDDIEGSRVGNIDEFIEKAAEYERGAENPSLEAFLQEVSLVADIDNYDRGSDSVSLMTVHSAKGLELPAVFITVL